MPEPDRDKTNVGSGLSLGLISPSPPHGQDTRRCRLSHLTKRRQRPVLAGSHACTGLPDRQTGTRQVEWLVARTQPAHSKIPAFPSAEATASATPRLTGAVDSGICQVTAPPLVNRQGATDPPHSRSRLRATSIRRRGSTIIMRTVATHEDACSRTIAGNQAVPNCASGFQQDPVIEDACLDSDCLYKDLLSSSRGAHLLSILRVRYGQSYLLLRLAGQRHSVTPSGRTRICYANNRTCRQSSESNRFLVASLLWPPACCNLRR